MAKLIRNFKIKATFGWLFIFILTACSTIQSHKTYKEKHPEMFIENHFVKSNLKFEDKLKETIPRFLKNISENTVENSNMKWLKISPEMTTLNDSDKKFINEELKKVPAVIKNLVNDKFLYLTIVKKLGASGLTQPIYVDDKNWETKNIVLMNEVNLKENFCDYINQKEATVYRKGPYKIGCIINKPLSKFLVIFIHELGHVISNSNYLIPHTDNLSSEKSINWYLYSRFSWKWDGNNFVIPNDEKLIDWQLSRKYFSYKEDERRDHNLIIDDFKNWKNSSFPSMYSAFSPEEDWAELFLLVVLKKYMGIELKYTLMKEGKVLESVSPCSINPVCEQKRKLIEFYIENPELFPH